MAGTSSSKSVGGETSQKLDRGLNVLQLLGSREHAAGMTVTELATALGVGRPIVYRLVATLEVRDFVTRREDGRIRLGLGITRLSQSVLALLRESTRPILRSLADKAGATAHPTVVEGGEALASAVVELSWTAITWPIASVLVTRLSGGAAGHAILAARQGRRHTWSLMACSSPEPWDRRPDRGYCRARSLRGLSRWSLLTRGPGATSEFGCPSRDLSSALSRRSGPVARSDSRSGSRAR